jgi:drug/metabolite transporter (DMT)-like permease
MRYNSGSFSLLSVVEGRVMGILLGLTAALGWGAADFLARYATRLAGFYRTLIFMQVVGFVGLGLYLALSGEFERLLAQVGWQPWAWAVLAALLNMFSSLALYRAFEVGVLTVVSPITASYAALTALLSLLSGEVISQQRGIGIGAVLFGVALAAAPLRLPAKAAAGETIDKQPARLTRGVGLALLSAVGYGIIFWIFGFQVIPALGGIVPVWLIRLMTLCVLVALAAPARQSMRVPRGTAMWLIGVVGLLDTSAYVANTIGLTTREVAVVTVLASLYSTVTVLLAWMFLRERLHWSQWLGIGAIFMGIALVSI